MGVFDKKERVKEKVAVDVKRAERAKKQAKAALENMMMAYENSVNNLWNETKVFKGKNGKGMKKDGVEKVVGPKEVIDALGSDAADVLNLQKELGDFLAKYDAEKVNSIKSKVGKYNVANGKVNLG